jgi:hypothetical protein
MTMKVVLINSLQVAGQIEGTVKACTLSRGIATFILKSDTRWGVIGSFMLWLLHHCRRNSCYPLKEVSVFEAVLVSQNNCWSV